MTLLDVLATKFPSASRTTLRRMIADGRVTVAGEAARVANRPIGQGETVEVRDRPAAGRRPSSRRGEPRPPFQILHEDSDLIVIDKPQGLITSSGPRDNRPTLIGLLQAFVAARDGGRTKVRLVHRLDADAEGVIVFSKNNAAHAALKRQFANHSAGRAYLALVDGNPKPPVGRIVSRLVELADGRVRSTPDSRRGEPAVSHYETASSSRSPARAVLNVRLETGRKHQIRVHLAERGWPIVNDPLYNPRRPSGPLCLAAVELSLDHPRTGRRVTFRRAPPVWAEGGGGAPIA